MYFFTSDTHFGHKNIIKFSNRNFQTIEEMDTALIKNWNAIVSPNDYVYHLGDFAFCSIERVESILSQLNGNKQFIFGNHDKVIRSNSQRLLDKRLFMSTNNALEIYWNKTMFYLHHYGCRVWNKSHYGSIHLYGHSHGSLPPHGKSVDVGVDAPFITGKPEYRPYSAEEIIRYMNTRQIAKEDYHGT